MLIPALAYSVVFLISSVLITVEIPQLFAERFGFNPQQLSLMFIPIIVGSIIGEQLGGVLSDHWMTRKANKSGERPDPEWRLWIAYPGLALTIIGYLVFILCLNHFVKFNVSSIIGAGIAAAGNQVLTSFSPSFSSFSPS